MQKFTLSKAGFREVPAFKRALPTIFLIRSIYHTCVSFYPTYVSVIISGPCPHRYVTDNNANKHWNKFSEEDYKFNNRLFSRYVKLDSKIMSTSTKLKKLPETDGATEQRDKKRKLAVVANDSPVKKTYKVSVESTDESESGGSEDEDDDAETLFSDSGDDERNRQ